MQHLQPGTDFGQACKLLREFVGISPSYPAHERAREREAPPVPVLERWAKRRAMRRDLPAWTYLTEVRRLPSVVVKVAIRREQVKEGPHESAWFAHRDHEGRLTGIEIRGPDYRGFSTGGDKTLFRLSGAPIGSRAPVTRLAVTKAPTPYTSVQPGEWGHTLEALG